MFRAIRKNIRIHAEFEESLTALCCVVQGLDEAELSRIRTAVRCISSRTGKQSKQVIDDCINEVLQGKPFNDTCIGFEVTLIFGGGL